MALQECCDTFTVQQQRQFDRQLQLEQRLVELDDDDAKRCALFNYLDCVSLDKVSVFDFGKEFDWLNVSEPLSLHHHLNGLVVVVDFFTYCCINCIHILPLLSRVEQRYKDSLVVIGIHSPKFSNEKELSNVGDAVLKYNITHPVANDVNGVVWSGLAIQCWPTLLILGPNAELLFTLVGEASVDQFLDFYCRHVIEFYSQKSMINYNKITNLPVKLLKENKPKSILNFPGKISASPDEKTLAIADTGHNRIVICDVKGYIKHLVGTGQAGFCDGTFSEAIFNCPQGIYWKNDELLYVCDTENHLIREISLSDETVKTLAGTGKQGHDRVGGKLGTEQVLSSPWDVCFVKHDQNEILFIAMAGIHQIWALVLSSEANILNKTYPCKSCLAFAGSGAEENRNNRYPHKAGFAQPSGLSYNHLEKVLYVADSESSSIRSIEITSGNVQAVVGGHRDPLNLFSFGDVDGRGVEAKLQHPLGIAVAKNCKSLFVVDSYNHKLKEVEITSKECITIAGSFGNRSNCRLLEAQFNEPSAVCVINDVLFVADTNNHSIKRIDLTKDFVYDFELSDYSNNSNNSTFEFIKTNQRSENVTYDFVIPLQKVSLHCQQILKIQSNFNFSGTIKPTKEARQIFELKLSESLKSQTEKIDLETDEGKNFKQFNLLFCDLKEAYSEYFVYIISRVFVCDTKFGLCKQFKLKFELPLEFINKPNTDYKNDVTVILPFEFNEKTFYKS